MSLLLCLQSFLQSYQSQLYGYTAMAAFLQSWTSGQQSFEQNANIRMLKVARAEADGTGNKLDKFNC